MAPMDVWSRVGQILKGIRARFAFGLGYKIKKDLKSKCQIFILNWKNVIIIYWRDRGY